jgi:hypothetical protein
MGTPKDDRIHPFTRIVAGLIIIVLLLAFIVLYIESTHTETNFAWTVQPPTSAILFGAGYTAGAFFFLRLLGQKKWHRVQAGFLPISAFTIIMLVSTLLHWSRFHHGAFSFYLWTGIYVVTPFLVPWLWWRNRATESKRLEEKDLRFRPTIRVGMGIVGMAGILFFLVVFFRPSILISLAPWKLTELTARVFCGWSLLTSASVLSLGMDGRWSATRIMLESALVAVILTLLALPRMWVDLDQNNPLTYIFIAALVVSLIAFGLIHVWLDRASRTKPALSRSGVVDE